MTTRWSAYAQSLTPRPMKDMLTGPVTILQWSFFRNDQPRSATPHQIALAIRDEVLDLERLGIAAIQIDEPALREGLPSHAAAVRDDTQIHTHICYSAFNDIISAIAALDADVIIIETSRSNMELLDAFATFHYPTRLAPESTTAIPPVCLPWKKSNSSSAKQPPSFPANIFGSIPTAA